MTTRKIDSSTYVFMAIMVVAWIMIIASFN